MARIDVQSTPRRGFLGGIAAGAGALVLGRWSSASAEVVSLSETAFAGDEWIAKIKGKYKQVFDVTSSTNEFAGAYPLNFITSTKDATKVADTEITPVLVFRHMGMPLSLNDAVWAKYKLGDMLGVKDPKTNAPATRNVHRDTIPLYAGETYETLMMKHGVVIVACNLALNVISGMAAPRANVSAEQAKKDFTAGLIPGIALAASGVYAVNRAQQAGCTYCYAG